MVPVIESLIIHISSLTIGGSPYIKHCPGYWKLNNSHILYNYWGSPFMKHGPGYWKLSLTIGSFQVWIRCPPNLLNLSGLGSFPTQYAIFRSGFVAHPICCEGFSFFRRGLVRCFRRGSEGFNPTVSRLRPSFTSSYSDACGNPPQFILKILDL